MRPPRNILRALFVHILAMACALACLRCGGRIADPVADLPTAFCRALVVDACAFPPGEKNLTGSWTGSAALELNIPSESEAACLPAAQVLDDYMPPEYLPGVIAAFEADPCNPDLRAVQP